MLADAQLALFSRHEALLLPDILRLTDGLREAKVILRDGSLIITIEMLLSKSFGSFPVALPLQRRQPVLLLLLLESLAFFALDFSLLRLNLDLLLMHLFIGNLGL